MNFVNLPAKTDSNFPSNELFIYNTAHAARDQKSGHHKYNRLGVYGSCPERRNEPKQLFGPSLFLVALVQPAANLLLHVFARQFRAPVFQHVRTGDVRHDHRDGSRVETFSALLYIMRHRRGVDSGRRLRHNDSKVL